MNIGIDLNGDGAWPDLPSRNIQHIAVGEPLRVAFDPTHNDVIIRIDIPDTQNTVIARVPLEQFLAATAAFEAMTKSRFVLRNADMIGTVEE